MEDVRIRITIDVFSGRENPVVEYSGDEIKDVAERLSPTRRMDRAEAAALATPTLGYRGLVVEQVGRPIEEMPDVFRVAGRAAFGAGFAHGIADEQFEDFVCGSVPPELPIEGLKREIQRFEGIIHFVNKWPWQDRVIGPKKDVCQCAPIYEPSWWNVSTRQPYNNCYNYSTNYRTDTFAQPGRAAGSMYTGLDCSAVTSAAVRDELIDTPGADNKCPEEGHLVALVIWPGWDYHWYRKGRDGLWSHKPGGTAVTDLDNSGSTISDPRTADRGGYTSFCTFMVVKHGHIKIN